MSSERGPHPAPRATVKHAVRGRLRLKLETPGGQGKLHRVADELREMPDTDVVRANHRARSVTVTYDPNEVSATTLLERLCRLGLIAVDLSDPLEWADVLAEQVVPVAEDPRTLPGRLNRDLLLATRGKGDLFRLTVGLLLLTAGLQVRRSLLRGEAIPWLRVLSYLLIAGSLWTHHRASLPASKGHERKGH